MTEPLFKPVEPKMTTVRLDEIEPWKASASNVTLKSVAALGFASAPLLQETGRRKHRYRVVAGRRRLNAAKEAGLEQVPALVLDKDVGRAEVLALGLTSNVARSHSPLDEADDIKGLIEEGMDAGEIAKVLGLSRQTIDKRLRLLEVPEPFLTAAREGKISSSVAVQLVDLTAAQREELAHVLAEKGTLSASDVKEVRQAAKADAVASLPANLFGEVAPTPARHAFVQAVKLALAQGETKEALAELLEEVQP